MAVRCFVFTRLDNLVSKFVWANAISDEYLFGPLPLVDDAFAIDLETTSAFLFLEGAMLGMLVTGKNEESQVGLI